MIIMVRKLGRPHADHKIDLPGDQSYLKKTPQSYIVLTCFESGNNKHKSFRDAGHALMDWINDSIGWITRKKKF